MPAMVRVVSPEMIVDFVNGRLDREEAETVRSVIASDDRARRLAAAAQDNRARAIEKLSRRAATAAAAGDINPRYQLKTSEV